MSIRGRIVRRAMVTVIAMLALVPGPARAQTEADRILAVVQELFDAMAARDADRAAAVLLPEGQLVAIRQGPDGQQVVSFAAHRDFVAQIGAGSEPWIERFWDAEVRVHGPLATVWAPYDFRFGDRFSHCGVDAVTLVRTGDAWRVAGVAYTVEREGCPTGPAPEREPE